MNPAEEHRAITPSRASRRERSAWALAASVATDGLWYLQLPGTVHLSPRALALLGYAPEDEMPSVAQLAAHVDAPYMRALRDAMRAVRRGERTRFELELRVLTRSGERRWMLLRARSRHGADGSLVVAGALVDVDRRKRAELALREEMRRDPLTGLPNRAALGDWLAARIARATDAPDPRFAVLYVDLDRFKVINDSLGHGCGDALLVEAARRLAALAGPDDLVARVGGDEFVVLLDAVGTESGALAMAARVHDAVGMGLDVDGREVFTSLSIGVRVSGAATGKPSDLLRDADLAMYEAKRAGGARTMTFDQRMGDAMATRYRMQDELHRALQHGELGLAYQPIFDARDARLCGFEALARWHHPTRGRLCAGDFVSEANESGLIVPIGRWVLGEACRQLAQWQAAYPRGVPLTIAVNLCDRELMDPDFVATVEGALAATGLPPASLVLEMTEGVMLTHMGMALPGLRRLRALGVQVQLDDFGKGYSSLGALRRMPLTAVKVDRSFIAEMVEDAEARAIVGTIAAFARALGLEVVAEGVETPAQAALLRELGGFRYVQGHLYGRPVRAGEAEGVVSGGG